MSVDFDALWDFHHPSESEARFRAALEELPAEAPDAIRAEGLTQLARSLGLQKKFDDAHETLDQASALIEAGSRAEVRYMLERGRVLNSSGAKHSALTFFLQALEAARANGEEALAVDAAHMLAIVEGGNEGRQWNLRAIAMAEASADPKARKWLGSLYNNTGWDLFDQGDYDGALDLFTKSRTLREANGQVREEQIARWTIARCLRALNRNDEALAMQRQLLEDVDEPDGYVFEELAELYSGKAQNDEARASAARAVELLGADAWFAEHESARLERMRNLAGGA